MRVFITGGSGYVGSAVSAALRKRGHDVVGLARSEESADRLLGAGVHPVRGSLSDTAVLQEMAHDADAIVHCAMEMSANAAALDSAALTGMFDGIESDHEAFIYTSGCWVYGDTKGVADENAPLAPTPLVAWRPAHEERVLKSGRGGRCIVIRPTLVYGGTHGIIAGMLESAKRGENTIVGDGLNYCNVVHVDDLAQLYLAALERGKPGIYNGAAVDVQMRDLADAMAQRTGTRPTYVPVEKARERLGPFADALALSQRVSNEKARAELEWEPKGQSIFTFVADA